MESKLSKPNRGRVQISGLSDLQRVDDLRAMSDPVMIGIGTLSADDPTLKVGNVKLQQDRSDQEEDQQPAGVVEGLRTTSIGNSKIIDEAAKTTILVNNGVPTDRIGAPKEKSATIRHYTKLRIQRST